MPKRLDVLNGSRHDSIPLFILDIEEAGFKNELDNARIIRTLTDKLDDVWGKVNRKGSYYISSATRPHHAYGSELVVTIHSEIDEDIKSQLILFVRPERDSLAVSRDVLGDIVTVGNNDIPYMGITVERSRAIELFAADKRFNANTFAAFQGVYDSLALINAGQNIAVCMTPTAIGLDVKYAVKGETLTQVLFKYNA